MDEIEINKNTANEDLVALCLKPARAGEAQAELMRRNTEALKESSKSAHKQSKIILFLTLILSTLAVTEFFLLIIPDTGSQILRYVMALTILFLVGRFLLKEITAEDW